jgi:hypothetical protein
MRSAVMILEHKENWMSGSEHGEEPQQSRQCLEWPRAGLSYMQFDQPDPLQTQQAPRSKLVQQHQQMQLSL